MMKLIFNIKKQSVLLLCFIFLYNCGDTGKKNVNFKKYLDSLTPEIKDVIDSYPNKDYLKELVEKNNAKEFNMYIGTPKIKLISPQQELQLDNDQKTLMYRKLKELIYKEEMELCINKKYKKLKYLVYVYTKINGCLEIKNMILKYILGELEFRKIENLNIRNFSKTPKPIDNQNQYLIDYKERKSKIFDRFEIENTDIITKQFLILYTEYSDNYLSIITLHKIYNLYNEYGSDLFKEFFQFLYYAVEFYKIKEKHSLQGYINISSIKNKQIIMAMNIEPMKNRLNTTYLKMFQIIDNHVDKDKKIFNLHPTDLPSASFFANSKFCIYNDVLQLVETRSCQINNIYYHKNTKKAILPYYDINNQTIKNFQVILKYKTKVDNLIKPKLTTLDTIYIEQNYTVIKFIEKKHIATNMAYVIFYFVRHGAYFDENNKFWVPCDIIKS